MNGTSVPQTVRELSRKKVMTAFLDGDRGGELILKELVDVADLDFITQAPPGKEVEELTKKEVLQALRDRKDVPEEDKKKFAKAEKERDAKNRPEKTDAKPQAAAAPARDAREEVGARGKKKELRETLPPSSSKNMSTATAPAAASASPSRPRPAGETEKETYRTHLENLIGSRAAIILNSRLQIIGKVPLKELPSTVKNVKDARAVILDGEIDQDLVSAAEKSQISSLVGMGSKVRSKTNVQILTVDDF